MEALIQITQGIGNIFITLIGVYIWVLIIQALLTFVNPDPYNPIVQFLHRITTPAYNFVRKLMPTEFNGLDLAPLILIIGLQILTVVLNTLLRAL